ncbi:MAG: hypothetical protein G01um101424_1, partial [Parcubacteria group bacterium Gr01-1014_24]
KAGEELIFQGLARGRQAPAEGVEFGNGGGEVDFNKIVQ